LASSFKGELLFSGRHYVGTSGLNYKRKLLFNVRHYLGKSVHVL